MATSPAPLRPLDVDGVRTVTIGTALWAVALVVLLARRDALAAAGHGAWTWTCLAGALLGLVGLAYCRRRRGPRRTAQGG